MASTHPQLLLLLPPLTQAQGMHRSDQTLTDDCLQRLITTHIASHLDIQQLSSQLSATDVNKAR